MTHYEYFCTGPAHSHIPSEDAIAAGVDRTRCIVCHKPIKYNRSRGHAPWGAYDRAAYIKRLRELR